MSDNITKKLDLYRSAEKTLGELDDKLFDKLFSHDIEDVFSSLSELEESGVFFVRFTPDYYSVRNRILLDPYKRRREDGTVEDIPVRSLGRKSKFTPHSIFSSLMERMIENHTRTTRNKFPIGRWYIDVGFTAPEMPHENASGGKSNIRIGQLIIVLLKLGYDPLLPIRREGFIKSVNKQIARIIVDTINQSRSSGKIPIRSNLESFAKKIQDFAKDYISGGVKPPLDKRTIYNRKSKLKNNSGLYRGSRGIYEPLSETGDLEASVFFRVGGENKWLSDLARWKKEKEERERRIKEIENESQKPKWREHQAPISTIVKQKFDVDKDLDEEILKERNKSLLRQADVFGKKTKHEDRIETRTLDRNSLLQRYRDINKIIGWFKSVKSGGIKADESDIVSNRKRAIQMSADILDPANNPWRNFAAMGNVFELAQKIINKYGVDISNDHGV